VADDRSNPKNWLGPYADADAGYVALRRAERPAFLASALAEYLEVREWMPEQLAQWLRCAPQQLAKLALCRRPDPSSPDFRGQVARIATSFQLDYQGLRRLLEDLALDARQRHQRRMTEDLRDPVRRNALVHRASGDFAEMFSASYFDPPPTRAASRLASNGYRPRAVEQMPTHMAASRSCPAAILAGEAPVSPPHILFTRIMNQRRNPPIWRDYR
jgi:hypothetical protein